MFGPEVEAAAAEHAVAEWPRESVGYVIGGTYVPQANIAGDRLKEFLVADSAWSDDVQAGVHSHICLGDLDPDRRAPSQSDMIAQLSAAVPFGIVASDGKAATPILWFGDHVLADPLIGRAFVPGVMDCYELVRAYFRQVRAITLKSFPRDVDWDERGEDLLMRGFAQAGFAQIAPEQARADDGLLLAIPGGRVNHCGVLLGDGTMLHHRWGQLSRREPWSGPWRRLTRMAVRYVGGGKNGRTQNTG